mmetsp:Transcript_14586/g.31049  ORF Transcript_14586/g.31049 Transcript_14586/m.31049 type:complete len:114 (-) Transcript_14586:679-1020(-)
MQRSPIQSNPIQSVVKTVFDSWNVGRHNAIRYDTAPNREEGRNILEIPPQQVRQHPIRSLACPNRRSMQQSMPWQRMVGYGMAWHGTQCTVRYGMVCRGVAIIPALLLAPFFP